MRWIALSEYAAERGVHRRTAQRWCREGRIPARRTRGGHWQVDVGSEPLRVTVSEAARATGRSCRTIREMCRRGELVARQLRPGLEWLIPASEIERIVPVDNDGGGR